jgi:hypothetical protein
MVAKAGRVVDGTLVSKKLLGHLDVVLADAK